MAQHASEIRPVATPEHVQVQEQEKPDNPGLSDELPNTDSWTFRVAGEADWLVISHLLTQAGLPLAGAYEHLAYFLLLVRKTNPGYIGGVAAIEPYGTSGLLRSVAIQPELRGKALGQLLVSELIRQTHARGLQELILLTLTAAPFFARLGFVEITREELAGSKVMASVEFGSVCPASATHMRLDLTRLSPELSRKPGSQVLVWSDGERKAT